MNFSVYKIGIIYQLLYRGFLTFFIAHLYWNKSKIKFDEFLRRVNLRKPVGDCRS